MKRILKGFYRFLCSIVYIFRCCVHGIKYKKGVKIRRGVRRQRGTQVILSENCCVGAHTSFWGGGKIVLGFNTHIGSYSSIYASKEGGVTFGENVNCAKNLYVIDANHSFSDKNELICKQPMEIEPVLIGSNCWIGVNCTLIKGSGLGNGCVVGACSLVNKKFSDNLVIGGIPAKVLKER